MFAQALGAVTSAIEGARASMDARSPLEKALGEALADTAHGSPTALYAQLADATRSRCVARRGARRLACARVRALRALARVALRFRPRCAVSLFRRPNASPARALRLCRPPAAAGSTLAW
jgi:hypothetical protein